MPCYPRVSRGTNVTLGFVTGAVTSGGSGTTAPNSSAGSQVNISQDGTTESLTCANSQINVSADDVDLTISGNCAQINVSGDHADITVDSVDQIVINGSQDNITYRQGSPHVTDGGSGNSVHQG